MFQIISKMRDVVDCRPKKPKEWETVFYYTVWVDTINVLYTLYETFHSTRINSMVCFSKRRNKIKFFIKLFTDF